MTPRGVWRILRLPLVISPVADIVAGYAAATIWNRGTFVWQQAALLAGVSAGLYLFGMVENDLVDVRRDRLMGVRRPLIVGEIGVVGAVVLLLVTLALAAACASQLVGGALALAIAALAAINFYNLGAKRGPTYVAMTVMGLCRLLNFGIGVAAVVGISKDAGFELLLPSGPLWARLGVAIFFTTFIVTGYSISARNGFKVSTRPWQWAFVITALVGFGLIAMSTVSAWQLGARLENKQFVPPIARVFAALLLPALWPGGLWSATGPERKPAEYAPFIERTLYWMVAMDAAFVLDALLRAH